MAPNGTSTKRRRPSGVVERLPQQQNQGLVRYGNQFAFDLVAVHHIFRQRDFAADTGRGLCRLELIDAHADIARAGAAKNQQPNEQDARAHRTLIRVASNSARSVSRCERQRPSADTMASSPGSNAAAVVVFSQSLRIHSM